MIVTSSTTASVTVAKLTAGSNLPVVFLSAGDPLRVVKSFASSGNNLTGISTSSLDLIPKRMELLKNLAPKIRRVIMLAPPPVLESLTSGLPLTREKRRRSWAWSQCY